MPVNSEETVLPTYPLDDQYYVDPDPRLLDLMRERAVSVVMTPEEVAVAVSHVHAWRRIVEEKRTHGLILEDDVFFEPGFAEQLNLTWKELPQQEDGSPDFDVLYVSFSEVERGSHREARSPNVLRLLKGYWWLSGYIISAAGARKLLASLPVTGPVDLWMNLRAATLNVYSTPRSIIAQRTDLQSDNRYSILPLLSQIGIQSDKSHLLLEQTRGRRPIVCVGFGAISAVTLWRALSVLAYRCRYGGDGASSISIERIVEEGSPLLFDAYVGVRPLSLRVERIVEQHPDAAFIVPAEYEVGSEITSAEYASAIEVLRRVRKDVLVFDAHRARGWRDLCLFLGCPWPQYPFPATTEPHPTVDRIPGPPPSARTVLVQEHDVHPWIVPYERLDAFGVARDNGDRGSGLRAFGPDGSNSCCERVSCEWVSLTDSFPSNLARFMPENVELLPDGGRRLVLEQRPIDGRDYRGASIRSSREFRYGRFEVIAKPARAPGVVSAFFVHRNDPWQEIDVEFLGCDTSKVLINVYYNPGAIGTQCNFGNRGTPVIVDLGFDAAEDFHCYTIEWEPHAIRWFVDGELIYVRGPWEPTPVPDLPMHVFCSIWPPRSVELAGDIREANLPVHTDVRRIKLAPWCDVANTASSHGSDIQREASQR
jgi:GR25 family glycosyltransferase involved in LPS biosynthesis